MNFTHKMKQKSSIEGKKKEEEKKKNCSHSDRMKNDALMSLPKRCTAEIFTLPITLALILTRKAIRQQQKWEGAKGKARFFACLRCTAQHSTHLPSVSLYPSGVSFFFSFYFFALFFYFLTNFKTIIRFYYRHYSYSYYFQLPNNYSIKFFHFNLNISWMSSTMLLFWVCLHIQEAGFKIHLTNFNSRHRYV